MSNLSGRVRVGRWYCHDVDFKELEEDQRPMNFTLCDQCAKKYGNKIVPMLKEKYKMSLIYDFLDMDGAWKDAPFGELYIDDSRPLYWFDVGTVYNCHWCDVKLWEGRKQ